MNKSSVSSWSVGSVWVLNILVYLTGCSQEPVPTRIGICIPGKKTVCTCSGNLMGHKVCMSDGITYSTCECDQPMDASSNGAIIDTSNPHLEVGTDSVDKVDVLVDSGTTDENQQIPPSQADTGAGTDSGMEASADSGSVESDTPLVPANGVLLGVYYGAASMSETDAVIGRTPAVHLTYYAWTDDWTRGQTAADLAEGRIPLVNWEPFTAELDDIIEGIYDEMIKERAIGAKQLGDPFFLDWGAEMNGDWSPWSGAQNGSDSAVYVAAYQHIHDIFVAEDATNVIWAWCPNVTDEPRATWNEAMNYYPGDSYVDWTCVDGYNWGTSPGSGRWQSFHQVFADIYPKLAAKGKPILIGEMASTELGGNKAQWIDEIVPTLKNDFPSIKGFVWFDINKETDWRIASSPESLDAFIQMAADPYLNP